jgi:hypothetical protein
MEITRQVTFDLTKIYFDDICHLAYVRSHVVGFQTWFSPPSMYSLEITFRDGATILTEYDDKEKWKTVIKLIEDNLTP